MLKRTKKDENNTSFPVGDTVEEKPAPSTLRPAVSQEKYTSEKNTTIGAGITIEGSIHGKENLVIEGAMKGNIEMGKHGVIVRRGRNQGVFLPQVATETGWDRVTFLEYLCSGKAGLSKDAWKDKDTELYIFTAQLFEEEDL